MIETLSVTVNNAFEVLFAAMNHNVSLVDNVYCIVKTISVSVDSAGTPIGTIGFPNTLATQIIGTQVIRAINVNNSNTYPISGILISYLENSKIVNINNITGLQPNTLYTLTIVAYG